MGKEPKAYSPPASLEAEQSVLGAILVRPEFMDGVADIITPSDFYRQAHGQIFQAMLDLYAKSDPVDVVTVTARLKDQGKLEAVGGYMFLSGLSEEVGFATNAVFYAEIVRDKAVLRRLLDCSQEIAGGCLGQVDNIAEFVDQAEGKVFEVAHGRNSRQVHAIKDLTRTELGQAENLHYQGQEAQGIKTGFYDYDRITAGLHPGELTILAARPAMGKTALALNITWNVGKRDPVVVFTLEMSKEQLTKRLIAGAGRIDGAHLKRCKLSPDEWVARNRVQDRLDTASIWIDDQPGLTPMQLRARCRRLKARHGLSLAIVDYIQLMKAPRLRSREEEVSHIAYALKELSKELSIPIIAVAQVSREIEKRSGTKYFLSDLRESGALEQAADNVLFLYREKDGVIGEMDLAKQRNGSVGTFKLTYSAPYTRFDNFAG